MIAGIFPGQGSEYPGMIENIKRLEITRDIFSAISTIADRDIFSVALEKNGEKLGEPLNAQLSIFGTSACYWHLLHKETNFNGLAGHSLGFYSALYAAGSLSLEDCVRTIMKVHEMIEETSQNKKGAMASVIGLKTEEVENICADSGDVFVSNINSATQIVISGDEAGVKKACEAALKAGALSIKGLPIPYPLHSPMMLGIEALLKPFIREIEIKKPSIPVISHINNIVLDTDDIAEVLCGQLTRKVAWLDTVKYFSDAGISRFIEIGPSDVLSRLARWINRDAEAMKAEEMIHCQNV